MSSQSSSVYDDPVECFEKLNLDDSFNETKFNDANQQIENKKENNQTEDKNDYLEDYFKIDNQHRLSSKWCIWFSKLSKTQGTDDYESKLKIIGKFQTIEQFWTLFSYLKRPHEFVSFQK